MLVRLRSVPAAACIAAVGEGARARGLRRDTLARLPAGLLSRTIGAGVTSWHPRCHATSHAVTSPRPKTSRRRASASNRAAALRRAQPPAWDASAL